MKTISSVFLIACASFSFTMTSAVLCPGQPSGNYCDCEGDCTGQPLWCDCEEAQACCVGATPTILCDGQPQENYCDCEGDCLDNLEWCACHEGRDCCEGMVVDVVSIENGIWSIFRAGCAPTECWLLSVFNILWYIVEGFVAKYSASFNLSENIRTYYIAAHSNPPQKENWAKMNRIDCAVEICS